MTSSSPLEPKSLTKLEFEDDEQILNYHDALIYGSDLRLFETRTEWLNDSCIHFVFCLLQQERQEKRGNPPSPSFLFMDPSVVSFWMHQCVDPDEIEDFVANTNFPGRVPGTQTNNDGSEGGGLIFVAVSDTMSTSSCHSTANSWRTPNSGSHWSLLVAEVFVGDGLREHDCSNSKDSTGNRSDGVSASTAATSTIELSFWHFDSIHNSGNMQAAEDIARKMRMNVYPGARVVTEQRTRTQKPTGSPADATGAQLVRAAETPQQQNGYDCGVHVLGSARIVAARYHGRCHSASPETKTPVGLGKKQRPSTTRCTLEELEDFLREEIGKKNNSQEFCAKLRAETSFEIRKIAFTRKER